MHKTRIDCVQLKIPIETERRVERKCLWKCLREFSPTQATAASTACEWRGNRRRRTEKEKREGKYERLDARCYLKVIKTRTRPSARVVKALKASMNGTVYSSRGLPTAVDKRLYDAIITPLTSSI